MKPKAVILVAAVISGLWLATPFALKFWYPDAPALRGQFGDMFGAVNALFTGLALIGAVYAISLQTEELRLQREELKNSTAEFRVQNEILRSQLETARAAQSTAETKERLASLPVLRYAGGGTSGSEVDIRFMNGGADVFNVTVTCEGGVMCVSRSVADVWENKVQAQFQFRRPVGQPIHPLNWAFVIHFSTRLGSLSAFRYEVGDDGTPCRKEIEKTDSVRINT